MLAALGQSHGIRGGRGGGPSRGLRPRSPGGVHDQLVAPHPPQVDDQSVNRLILGRMLSKLGAPVRLLGRGSGCLAALRPGGGRGRDAGDLAHPPERVLTPLSRPHFPPHPGLEVVEAENGQIALDLFLATQQHQQQVHHPHPQGGQPLGPPPDSGAPSTSSPSPTSSASSGGSPRWHPTARSRQQQQQPPPAAPARRASPVAGVKRLSSGDDAAAQHDAQQPGGEGAPAAAAVAAAAAQQADIVASLTLAALAPPQPDGQAAGASQVSCILLDLQVRPRRAGGRAGGRWAGETRWSRPAGVPFTRFTRSGC